LTSASDDIRSKLHSPGRTRRPFLLCQQAFDDIGHPELHYVTNDQLCQNHLMSAALLRGVLSKWYIVFPHGRNFIAPMVKREIMIISTDS
jgi:hypothetical protein